MPNKSTTNNRRINEAKKALRKVHVPLKRASPQSIKRTRQNRGSRSAALSTQNNPLWRYYRSILLDRPMSGVDLPSYGYTGRYSTINVQARTTLTAGLGVEASCLVNPYMLFTDEFWYERYAGSVAQWQYVPSIIVNSSTTDSGKLPNSTGAVGAKQFTQLFPTNCFSSDSTLGYTAKVRPKYVHFKLVYTGTELNKGGMVQFIHNPQQLSMLNYPDVGGTLDPNFGSSITSAAVLSGDFENVTIHHIGEGLEFTWRPRDHQFKNVTSRAPASNVTGVAGSNTQNTHVDEYLADPENARAVTPLGWTTGFRLQPATGTAATALPYELEISAELDVFVMRSDNLNASYLQTGGTKVGVSHPVHEAVLSNITAALHAKRSARAVPHHASILGMAESEATSVLKGAAESFGASIMSRLPAMV